MKRSIVLLILFFLTLALYAQNVSDFEIQVNDNGTMTILNYKGLAKDFVIPEKIFNMPVSRLREGAFAEKGLTSVVIPSTVTYIGDKTFRQNRLTRVTIPETVEYIGNDAFQNNQLTAITIPPKVLTIGNNAFADNRLTSVTIPDSVIFIGSGAFASNSITKLVIGNGVVYIGDRAFYDHRISTIVIPERVVYIGGQAFEPTTSNSLVNITIGKYIMFGINYGDGPFSRNGNFDIIYQNMDKRAGTYTYANGNWTYTP